MEGHATLSKEDLALVEKLPKTPPFDPRFPNTNQKRNCVQNYLDFHRCEKKLGSGNKTCEHFKASYRSLCPEEWVEKWDTQVAENRFPGKI